MDTTRGFWARHYAKSEATAAVRERKAQLAYADTMQLADWIVYAHMSTELLAAHGDRWTFARSRGYHADN
jgi:hypothetical protein